MSDLEGSAVTYTSVYTDFEPWRFQWVSDEEAPPSPDYVPGLEHPPSPDYVPSPEYPPSSVYVPYVPEPEYPEYLVPSDDEVILPAEKQPLPLVVSPTAVSPGIIDESDLEEDPEEYKADKSEDGPVDYSMDGGDDDDDSSGDDADDEDEPEEEEYEDEEEEEHVAPADSMVAPAIGARISVRPQTPPPVISEAEAERLLTLPLPSPSPLVSLSSPFIGERLARFASPAPSLPPSSSLTQTQSLQVSSTQALIDAVNATLPPPHVPSSPLPPLPPSLYISLLLFVEVGYGIREAWVDPTEVVPVVEPMTLGGVNDRVTELAKIQENDVQDLYALHEDAQDRQTRLAQQVNLLMGDSRDHEDQRCRSSSSGPVVRDSQANEGHADPTKGIVGTTKTVVQVKFAICTLLGAALTWWNGQVRTLGPDAYAMTWEVLKNKMTDKYYPQGEIKKLEIEFLLLMRKRRLTSTSVDFLITFMEMLSLPNPRRWMRLELANDLMDQKLRTYAERQTDNKRKADDLSRSNHGHQQQPFKRQNVSKVYNIGSGEKKLYGGSLPKCTKCHFHHNGLCTQKCHDYNKVGHFARDCRGSSNTNVANTQRDNRAVPKGNGCFECGAPGNFKRDCLKLKNKDGRNGNPQGWVYVVGNPEKNGNASRNPESNVVTENSYDVELATEKIVGVDTIIWGCTLNFLNHPFNIDLMPVELGSFDIVIGMDWLRKYHVVIVCDEKLVRIPYGGETLIF
ncbi:putative reverse transcriptase domain-containing protein, partial [Tanacetum coccineum]